MLSLPAPTIILYLGNTLAYLYFFQCVGVVFIRVKEEEVGFVGQEGKGVQ